MKQQLFSLIIIAISLIACEESRTPKLDTSNPADFQSTLNPIDSINNLIKEDPNRPELYFERAKLHYANRDVASSLNDVGRSLKLDSNNIDYYLLLADLKLLSKQSRESRDILLKAHQLAPENIEVLLNLGELYMIVQDEKASFKYLNQALKIDIYNARAYRLKGFNYKYLKDTINAVSSFQTAIEQDPNDYDSYLQLGLFYTTIKSSLAEDYFKNALSVNPTSLEALYALGSHYQSIEDSRNAINTYNDIIDLNANYFNAYYNKGYVYLVQLEKYDSAALEFRNAISFGPENYYDAHYNLGLCMEYLGDSEQAMSQYREALNMNPQHDLSAKGVSRLSQ